VLWFVAEPIKIPLILGRLVSYKIRGPSDLYIVVIKASCAIREGGINKASETPFFIVKLLDISSVLKSKQN